MMDGGENVAARWRGRGVGEDDGAAGTRRRGGEDVASGRTTAQHGEGAAMRARHGEGATTRGEGMASVRARQECGGAAARRAAGVAAAQL
jgi:hypothetical protein